MIGPKPMSKSVQRTPDDALHGLYRRYSTRIFVALALLVAAVLTLPGEMVFRLDIFVDGKHGPHFPMRAFCEHGWPFTYLRRGTAILDNPPYYRLSRWNIFEGVVRFKAFSLIADIALDITVALVGAFLLDAWLRKRNWRIYTCDLFVLTGIVAAGATLYVFHRGQHRNQQHILQAISGIEDQAGNCHWDISERVEWQLIGPTWLRDSVGDPPLAAFDRIIGVDTPGGEEIEQIVKLATLRVVRIAGKVSNRQLKMLEQLPQLEALDMCYSTLDDDRHEIIGEIGDPVEQCFRLPKLPNLRGLNLYGTAFRGDGLENVPSIEVLELGKTDIDDRSVPALAALHNLKQLGLYGTAISDSGIDQLRRALPNCDIQPVN